MEHKGAQGACDDGRVSRDVINAAKWAAFMMQGSNGDGSVARALGGDGFMDTRPILRAVE